MRRKKRKEDEEEVEGRRERKDLSFTPPWQFEFPGMLSSSWEMGMSGILPEPVGTQSLNREQPRLYFYPDLSSPCLLYSRVFASQSLPSLLRLFLRLSFIFLPFGASR